MLEIAIFIIIIVVFGMVPSYFYLKHTRQPEAIQGKYAHTRWGYKKCPECQEMSIPNAWILFDGLFLTKNDCCYRCHHCQKDIRKRKWIILDILFSGTWIEGTLFILLALWFSTIVNSLVFGVVITIATWFLQHMITEYTARLEIATEDYCKSCLSETDAYLIIILAVLILLTGLYFLLQ